MEPIIDFLGRHADTIIMVLTLVGGYFGIDIKSRRASFRKQTWLEASKIAFKAVELAGTQGWTGADKAKKAISLAEQYMAAFELTPTDEEKLKWQQIFASLSTVEKTGKGAVTGPGN